MFPGNVSTRFLIENCIVHDNEELCLDALELISVTCKETEAPSLFEVDMMKLFLLHNLKSAKSNFRSVSVVKFSKWLQRIKEVVKRVLKRKEPLPLCLSWVQWAWDVLVSNLYPGNPYSREQLVLSLMKSVTDIWPPSDQLAVNLVFYTQESVTALMHGILSKFDSCRELSYEMLKLAPSPLPGFQDFSLVLKYAFASLYSKRSRECETSAFLMLLGYQKYVEPNNWVPTDLFPAKNILELQDPDGIFPFYFSIVTIVTLQFLSLILNALFDHIDLASSNLEKAAKEKPMHGLPSYFSPFSFFQALLSFSAISSVISHYLKYPHLKQPIGGYLSPLYSVASTPACA